MCDLLVVFENHVIIFSDKDCEFPNLADQELAWRRWYKRAIVKSAHQVWGAERWIRNHPNRLFLDRACTMLFPIDLPNREDACFHRIVVAHDTTGRRKRLIGGSGSLLIDPDLIGDMHFHSRDEGGHPFAVGQLDPARGYVHVLDDASLGVVMQSLDTIKEFIDYLSRKEALITSGRLHGAFGEEDLLAYYLKNANEDGQHDFVIPKEAEKILLEEGHWADLISRPEYQRKMLADRISYGWDEMIENVASHAVGGSLVYTSTTEIAEHERRLLRVLAREPRVRRRMLARAFGELIVREIPDGERLFRSVQPSFPGDPHYVFLVARPPKDVGVGTSQWADYREDRRTRLNMYCMVAMHHFRDASQVIGLATENGSPHGRSYDFVSIHRDNWDAEMAADAVAIQEQTGWLTNVRETRGIEDEYPVENQAARFEQRHAPEKIGRNEACPCGSGAKYKKCHGGGR